MEKSENKNGESSLLVEQSALLRLYKNKKIKKFLIEKMYKNSISYWVIKISITNPTTVFSLSKTRNSGIRKWRSLNRATEFLLNVFDELESIEIKINSERIC